MTFNAALAYWEDITLDRELDRIDRGREMNTICPVCNQEGVLSHERDEFVVTNKYEKEGYKVEIMWCENCGDEMYFEEDGGSGKVVKPVDQWRETRP